MIYRARIELSPWAHTYGSPWWYLSAPDGGFHVGICEYRTGRYRVYTAPTVAELQTGYGRLEGTETSLAKAQRDGERRVYAITTKVTP